MADLALHDLSAEYGGQRVLGPLSITVVRGERVALVGRSGAGKSTLLGLMFERWQRSPVLLPQDLGLVQTLSVFHNVYMGRLSANPTWYNLVTLVRPFRQDVSAITALLSELSIDHKLWAPVGELSGGQQQRTAVARALYQRGDVLLADEPVAALDGPQAESVMAALTGSYKTAVIAMHDVELALRFTQRVVGINNGVIALDQPSCRLSAQDLLPLY